MKNQEVTDRFLRDYHKTLAECLCATATARCRTCATRMG